MPEIKHVFNQGKMNKDLDERLVKNGQYRDAMNIQVSTSEGSDVGTVQNILGNTGLFSDNTIAPGSKCIGAIADEKNDCFYWFIQHTTKNIILKYQQSTISFIVVDTENILKFHSDKIITGINVIDNFLLWTDNYNEPKKIDVALCEEGTDQGGFYHTHLIVPKRNITNSNCIKLREEHITVIKKSPLNKLTVDPVFQSKTTATSDFDFVDDNGDIMSVGETGQIQFNSFSPINETYRTGDIILFSDFDNTNELPEIYEIRVKITNELILADGLYEFKILSISAEAPLSAQKYNCEREIDDALFPRKFVRFGYRYKFQDNQYSSFSSFTDVIFKPSEFEYNSKEAYNKAMENVLVSLKVRNFITKETPEDVVQVDILYKESNSPTVYIVDKIKYNDYANVKVNEQEKNFWNANLYEIKSDLIYAVVPENQLLRVWDNIPRKALAQEITGNRLVYGNYVQNYNLDIKPALQGDYESRFIENTTHVNNYIKNQTNIPVPQQQKVVKGIGQKSLKSLRNYQLGITYLDKYNRETPIFTSTESRFVVPKRHAEFKTKVRGKVTTPPPSWASAFKVYVKETSTEYYNLAMYKPYRAEDGNLWISFPSSERNKVDEETFLILKKSIDVDELVREEAKYKILAIENEAPEYIAVDRVEIGDIKVGGAASTGNTTDPNKTVEVFATHEPQINSKFFRIVENKWLSTGADKLDEVTEPLLVTFKSTTTNEYTSVYEISSVVVDNAFYKITLGKNFKSKDSELIYPNHPSTIDATGTNPEMGKDIVMIIYKEKEVSFKAEFKGMFFVKIANDSITEKHVMTVEGGVNYEIIHSLPAHNFADYANPSVANNSGTTESFGGISGSEEEWTDLLDFGGTDNNLFPNATDFSDSASDGSIGGFFIDKAWYRDIQPGGGCAESDHSNPSHCLQVVRNIFQEYADAGSPNGEARNWNKLSDIYKVNNWYDLYRLDPSTANFSKGIYTDENNRHYVEISFSGIGGPTNTGSRTDGNRTGKRNLRWGSANLTSAFKPEINAQALKDYGNNYSVEDDELKNIIKNLKGGRKFKVKGDNFNNIYEIQSVEIIKKYNHYSPFSLWALFKQYNVDVTYESSFEERWDQFQQPTNRRTTYKIRLNKSLTNTRVGPNNDTIDFVDPTDLAGTGTITRKDKSISFQFVEQKYSGTENTTVSENPAIWETEPKETADLDIYHEASGIIPLFIDDKSNAIYAPLGSVVTCKARPAAMNDGDTYITAWNGNKISFNQPIKLDKYQPPGKPSVRLVLTRPDNSYASLRIDKTASEVGLFDANGNVLENTYVVVADVSQEVFGLSWFNCYSFGNGVESNRIRDDFNQPIIDKGVKVSTILEENYEEEKRSSGLIFSGIYNTNSGVNNLNQFIQAEAITKDLNPTYGSVQKLYSRSTADGDLIALCEDRVVKILANKDALFNADGNTNLTATNRVLGQAIPYAGEYGISQNPESFAGESYRVYFTDKQRGAVLRLSRDGLTPISEYGMSDYFKDTLRFSNKLIGSYDDRKGEYNITIPRANTTVSYKENVKGWSSFKSFVPEIGISMSNDYYTFDSALPYKHHAEKDSSGNSINRNTFYNVYTPSSVNVLLNDAASTIKSYKALNYEGSQSRVNMEATRIETGYYNLKNKEGWAATLITTDKQKGFVPEFIEKEGKWFNNIKGLNIQAGDLDSNGNVENKNLKTDEFSFQGVGRPSSIEINESLYPVVFGCMRPNASNYNQDATVDDGSCIYVPVDQEQQIGGCMDTSSSNYNIDATYDDGSCIYVCDVIPGCTDPNAFNFNPEANTDDGSCVVPVYGCTDQFAINYDPNANVDNNTCEYYSDDGGGRDTDDGDDNTTFNATFTVKDINDPDTNTIPPPNN